MNWNKLKKATISTIFELAVFTMIFACITGMGYIAMTFPLIEAIIIELVIFFCILIVCNILLES